MSNTSIFYQLTPEQIVELAHSAVDADQMTKAQQKRFDLISTVEYFTANQSAKIIGVTVETFRRYVREGHVKGRDCSETERYHVDELQKFLGRTGKKQSVGSAAKKP